MGPLQESILRRAQDKGIVTIWVHDLRSWTRDRHHVVDDEPYVTRALQRSLSNEHEVATANGAVLRFDAAGAIVGIALES